MPQAYSDDHVWVAATYVPLPANLAKHAQRRGTVRIPPQKVDILEVMCHQCRRLYEEVAAQPCEAAENRDHLIGGPIGERKKRKHPYDDHPDTETMVSVQGDHPPVTATG